MTNTPSHPEAKAYSPQSRSGGDGADAGSAFSAGLRIWEEETSRFLDELIRQDRRTLDRLCECKSPLDVLSVEQDWVRARSRAYLESGLRFAEAFAAISRETAGHALSAGPDASRPAGHLSPQAGGGSPPV
jgi:hypothetical protein